MNVVAWVVGITGVAFVIAAVQIRRDAKRWRGYHSGGRPKNLNLPKVGENGCDYTIVRPHDPIHSRGPYIGEFKPPRDAGGVIPPPLHSVWRHRNGNLYIVQRITNVSPDGAVREGHPVGVLYQTLHNLDTYWHRDLSDWHRSFTYVDYPTPP